MYRQYICNYLENIVIPGNFQKNICRWHLLELDVSPGIPFEPRRSNRQTRFTICSAQALNRLVCPPFLSARHFLICPEISLFEVLQKNEIYFTYNTFFLDKLLQL